jgi:hypothetical protein
MDYWLKAFNFKSMFILSRLLRMNVAQIGLKIFKMNSVLYLSMVYLGKKSTKSVENSWDKTKK